MDPNALDSERDCLCLLCRQKGHVVEGCAWFIGQQEHPGSERSTLPHNDRSARPSSPFKPFPTNPTEEPIQALCQQCSQLGAVKKLTNLRPFVSEDLEDFQSRRATRKATQIPSLGLIRTLRLLSTCPLCRLIFDVTYLTDEDMEIVGSGGELVAISAWTICRIDEYLYWRGSERGEGPYAKCIYTSVAKWSGRTFIPKRLVEDTADALGLDVRDRSDGTPALGVRQVNPKAPDYRLIKDWLSRCDDLHYITCRPLISDGLKQIKLIDVETRQIVMYPDGCDYITLSYVWGGVVQPSYRLGDLLPTVPATLEDAMVVTRNLGKRYLWVDSLCIDQEDNAEKVIQIGLMSAIYSGAWATIFCLSGQSARSGLPRVGASEGLIPQLSREISGTKLLSTMPTLSQQISWSPWASRAWTYQEGLLSPRRLFFTNHQVYFECNSVHCCESLDDTRSPFHNLTDIERQAKLRDVAEVVDEFMLTGPGGVIGQGILRDPFRPLSSAEGEQTDVTNFERYRRLVHSYTTRKMSYDADSLNAFSAMLTRLKAYCYKRGFVYGLPVDDIQNAILWFHSAPSRRRLDFPTWSWAGWEGGVSDKSLPGVDGGSNAPDAIMPPLRIWKTGDDDHPELIYDFSPIPSISKERDKHLEEENRSQDGEDKEGSDEQDGDVIEEDSDSAWEDEDDESQDDEEEDADSWEEEEDTDSWEDFSLSGSEDADEGSEGSWFFKEIDYKTDPIFQFAKTMLEDSPRIPSTMGGNELLVEGIVIRVNFSETPKDHHSDSESDDERLHEGRCSVRLKGKPKRQRLMFYGHNAEQLAIQRNGKEQEFLLVRREHAGVKQKVQNSLLLIDREGDVASRVGVASLRLDDVELLECLQPERRLFKLK